MYQNRLQRESVLAIWKILFINIDIYDNVPVATTKRLAYISTQSKLLLAIYEQKLQ